MFLQVRFSFWWVVFPTSNMKIAKSFDLCMHGVKQKKRKCWPLQGIERVSAATVPRRQIASQCWRSILTTGLKLLSFAICFLSQVEIGRGMMFLSVVRVTSQPLQKNKTNEAVVAELYSIQRNICVAGGAENLHFVSDAACKSTSSPALFYFCIKG